MAIYGIGAYYDQYNDVSNDFINNNIIGTGWADIDAPDTHAYFKALKVGDIIYIKAAVPGKPITVKGIGVITDNTILTTANHPLTKIGRNVRWLHTKIFTLPVPDGKNNVRLNTIYEEFHPLVQQEIIQRL